MRNAARSPAATRTRAAASWLRDASASIPAVPPASGPRLYATRAAALLAGQCKPNASHISQRRGKPRSFHEQTSGRSDEIGFLTRSSHEVLFGMELNATKMREQSRCTKLIYDLESYG
jgi:hypothetical protein